MSEHSNTQHNAAEPMVQDETTAGSSVNGFSVAEAYQTFGHLPKSSLAPFIRFAAKHDANSNYSPGCSNLTPDRRQLITGQRFLDERCTNPSDKDAKQQMELLLANDFISKKKSNSSNLPVLPQMTNSIDARKQLQFEDAKLIKS